jgi:hypothetical protein
MTLSFTPTVRTAAPDLLESTGDETAVRAHAANILRAARARGERPRTVLTGVMQRVYRLSNGLLKLCL